MDQENGIAAATASVRLKPLFEARAVSKSFGDVAANKDISLTVHAGEKHALLGENGAGKSTFVKMIDGVLRPDTGAFYWNERAVSITSPAVARRLGIGMVFQHFSTFDALTVADNIAIGVPDLSMSAIRRKISEMSERYGLALSARRRVETLSAGEKQRVEIVRALLQNPKMLILDEPTSVLTPPEADNLFATLNTLAADGMAIIYISHRLPEIRAFCDRATVLRQGEVVGQCDPQETSLSDLAEMMIGKKAAPVERRDTYVGGVRLRVDDLSMPAREGLPLKNVSLNARRGEILGIAGVAGEGQDTLYAALSGERRTPYARKITLDDRPIGALGPTERRRLGAAFAPEQRLGHAAVGDLSLSENLRLTRHGLQGAGSDTFKKRAAAIRETYDVRAGAGDPKAATLSGGNLQKFVIGRELDRDPAVFVVSQPTWGVDPGAATVIRNELVALTQRGAAVVMISQDLDEIFQIADRVTVLHRGTLSDIYMIEAMTPEKIGLLMAGADPNDEDDEDQPAETPADTAAPSIAAAPDAEPAQEIGAPAPVSEDPAPVSAPAVSIPVPATALGAQEKAAQNRHGFSMQGTVITPWTPPETFQSFEPRQ